MSVGANTRAATRARSKKEFTSKLGIVVEEADECCFWMELLTETGLIDNKRIAGLYQEAIEITKIMAVSRKNSRDGGS
jgi:four helix bundle protein